jgi:hypothetical protein
MNKFISLFNEFVCYEKEKYKKFIVLKCTKGLIKFKALSAIIIWYNITNNVAAVIMLKICFFFIPSHIYNEKC